MADIVRAIYVLGDEIEVRFSGWVHEDNKAEILAELAAVNPPMNGGNPGVEPTVLGWETVSYEEP